MNKSNLLICDICGVNWYVEQHVACDRCLNYCHVCGYPRIWCVPLPDWMPRKKHREDADYARKHGICFAWGCVNCHRSKNKKK